MIILSIGSANHYRSSCSLQLHVMHLHLVHHDASLMTAAHASEPNHMHICHACTPGSDIVSPGAQLIFAAIGLPLGLGLIIICGAELYTANAAWLPAAVFEGRANMTQLAKNWFFSYFGNLCGCLIVVWLVDEVSAGHLRSCNVGSCTCMARPV